METAPGTVAGAAAPSTPTKRSTAEIAGRRAAALRKLEMRALRKTMSTSKDADEILAAADKVVALEALLDTPTQATPAVAADGDGGARRGKRSVDGRARRRARSAKSSAAEKGVALFTGSDVKGYIDTAVAAASQASRSGVAEEVTRLLKKQRTTLQHNHKTVVRQVQSKAAKRVVRERHARKGAEKAKNKAAGAARQKQGVPRESATEQRRQQTKAGQKQKKAAHLQRVRNNFYAGHHQRQQQQQRHQPQHQHQHQQR